MKIDGVRVVARHREGCEGKLWQPQGCRPLLDRAGRKHQSGVWLWFSFVCEDASECPCDVLIRADKICEFAADLMRQVEGK